MPGMVAVLHQGHAPPEIEGIRKPLKPGGYADSSADIAFVLQANGVPVLTPAAAPDPARDGDWSFPDTAPGIAEALERGAGVLWANTVLYDGHPIVGVLAAGIAIVGQSPDRVQRFDDKRHTNELLRAAGCPVPAALVVAENAAPGRLGRRALTEQTLAQNGIAFPIVVKPIRGRGSAGVRRVERAEDLAGAVDALLGAAAYGTAVLVEEYLPGDEVTISALPPGRYRLDGDERAIGGCWTLPPVLRFNHEAGIAPYNGVVAVTRNSRLAEPERRDDAALRALGAHCARAAGIVGARSVIRIDCRQDRQGRWRLFDLNMKPNMTGPGRPGRADQDSLTAIAARGIGWSYADLLVNLLAQAWTAARR